MENPAFKDQQRTITYARLLGELYCAALASGQLIIQQLYKFINFGHEIPDPLREASEKHLAKFDGNGSAAGANAVPNSSTGVSQTIQEDEEMEEKDLEPKVDVASAALTTVAVSPHSKYDPRVATHLDPPNSAFRIKLVCTLLEVVGKTIVTRNNIPKLEGYLAAFQRYLFTKTFLPTEVEFALLDTFDIVDSQWRKVGKEPSGKVKKNDNSAVEKASGFPRFASWLDAHNACVALEETEATYEVRAKSRLESLAGESKNVDGDASVVSSILDELMDEDDDSSEDALSASARDSLADDHDSVDMDTDDEVVDDGQEEEEESASEGSDDEEDSDASSDEDSDDEEGSDDEFDEQAYMRQLEDEAFERELRRLTMDALEKGKTTARGGKVADTMPTGSQFIKKKPSSETAIAESGPAMTLAGKQGISFQLLKKGNKGKLEAKSIVVPTDTNLALVATKQDDAAARERDMIKARVLQYEAESAESHHSGGNVYLEQEKLQVIRNRPLSMEDIDRNFGTTGGNLHPGDKARAGSSGGVSGSFAGRGGSSGRGVLSGRGRGRGGRGNASGRTLV